MKVYHIIKNDLMPPVGNIIQPKTYNLNNMRPKKRQIEQELESIRNIHFSDFPSRLKCIFVCYDMEDVEFWAIQKYDICGGEFNVLIIETSKPVFWFSAESYNMYFNGQRNDLHQACIEFWESNSKTKMNELVDREGLTSGEATIIAVRRAMISRGKGIQLL